MTDPFAPVDQVTVRKKTMRRDGRTRVSRKPLYLGPPTSRKDARVQARAAAIRHGNK